MVTTSAATRNGFLRRVGGAIVLRVATYEEVEADHRSTGQAVAVVVLSSVAAGLGARGFGVDGALAVLVFTLVALTAWVAWTFVVYQLGTRLLPGSQTHVDVGQLLRTTGFATAPGLLRIVGVVPGLTIASFAVAALWMLLAMIVAVRQALDYTSTAHAIAVCVFGWILIIALAGVFAVFFGSPVS